MGKDASPDDAYWNTVLQTAMGSAGGSWLELAQDCDTWRALEGEFAKIDQ